MDPSDIPLASISAVDIGLYFNGLGVRNAMLEIT